MPRGMTTAKGTSLRAILYSNPLQSHLVWAYMDIWIRSIHIYFGILFHFIHKLLYFHCSHIVSIFSKIFPIFVATLFIRLPDDHIHLPRHQGERTHAEHF